MGQGGYELTPLADARTALNFYKAYLPAKKLSVEMLHENKEYIKEKKKAA